MSSAARVVVLEREGWRAVVDPQRNGCVADLSRHPGLSRGNGASAQAGDAGGLWLPVLWRSMPGVDGIASAGLTFEGPWLGLPVGTGLSEPVGAIATARGVAWSVMERTPGTVRLMLNSWERELSWSWAFRAVLRYEVVPGGLRAAVSVTNMSSESMPVSVGAVVRAAGGVGVSVRTSGVVVGRLAEETGTTGGGVSAEHVGPRGVWTLASGATVTGEAEVGAT